VYWNSELPPVLVGAVQLTVAARLPAVAVTPVGAPGNVLGVTAFDGADAGPVPVALVAETVKVYVVPFVKPVTVVDVAGGVPLTVTGVFAVEPTNGVTVYLVIPLPPLSDGAVQLTVAEPLPAVAVTPVGADGAAGWVSVTSSRYIHVLSELADPSSCTLNQSTTFWPA
jgi:hypothetical protein